MRPYPIDSPEAAARIVALALVADGRLDRAELAQVEALGVPQQLGLSRAGWHGMLNAFCEDLLDSPRQTWGDACRVDPLTLQHLLGEVSDPRLRECVLALCLAAAEADAEISDGEALVLGAAVEQWGLQAQMMRAGAPA